MSPLLENLLRSSWHAIDLMRIAHQGKDHFVFSGLSQSVFPGRAFWTAFRTALGCDRIHPMVQIQFLGTLIDDFSTNEIGVSLVHSIIVRRKTEECVLQKLSTGTCKLTCGYRTTTYE
jgi:hypothetical protein